MKKDRAIFWSLGLALVVALCLLWHGQREGSHELLQQVSLIFEGAVARVWSPRFADGGAKGRGEEVEVRGSEKIVGICEEFGTSCRHAMNDFSPARCRDSLERAFKAG